MKLLVVGFATIDLYPDGERLAGGAAGGMSLNAANLGHEVWLLAPLSNDSAGLWYQEQLNKKGINYSLSPISETNSIPTCIINDPFAFGSQRPWQDNGAIQTIQAMSEVDQKLDSFDAIICANAHFSLIQKLVPSLRGRSVFYIPGPRVVLDQQYYLPELFEFTEVMFGNEEEMRVINKTEVFTSGVKLLVETLGQRGCRVWRSGDKADSFAATRIDRPVDATGAGDCFALGFVVKCLESGDIGQSVMAGNQLAAQIISKPGVLL